MNFPWPPWISLFTWPVLLVSLTGWGLMVKTSFRHLGLRWFAYDSPAEKGAAGLFTSFGLGCGSVPLLVLLAGALHLLYAVVLWLLVAGGLLFFWRYRKELKARDAWAELKPENLVDRIILVILLLVFIYQALGCLLPATGQDELTYHLTYPRQFLIANKIHCTPNIFHVNSPLNAHMLYLLSLSMGTEILCKLLQLSQCVFIVMIIIAWTRSILPSGGYFAALLYLTPVASVYMRAPNEAGSDIPVAFWFALGFFFASKINRRHWLYWTVLAAAAAGFSWGTKYTALAFVTPPLVIFVLWQLYQAGIGLKKWLMGLGLFCLVIVILFTPWMIKNGICTGNPIYPFLKSYIPTRQPLHTIAERIDKFEDEENFYLHYAQSLPPYEEPSLGGYLQAALLAYRDIKVHWSSQEGDFFLALYPLFALAGLFLPWKTVRGLSIAALAANILFIFIYASHLNRYFSVTYSLGAVIAAVCLGQLGAQVKLQRFFFLLFSLVMAVSLAFYQIYWSSLIHWYGKPVLSRSASKDYLKEDFANPAQIEMFSRMEKLLPADAYILGHGVRYVYHCPRRIYVPGDFEKELITLLRERCEEDWECITTEVRQMGFTHLLIIERSWLKPLPEEWLNENTSLVIQLGNLELRKLDKLHGASNPLGEYE